MLYDKLAKDIKYPKFVPVGLPVTAAFPKQVTSAVFPEVKFILIPVTDVPAGVPPVIFIAVHNVFTVLLITNLLIRK